MYKIAVMEGDGIGPEIVRETVRVLETIQKINPDVKLSLKYLPVGLTAFESHGSTLPDRTIQALEKCDAAILGPVSTHIYDQDNPQMVNPSGVLRTTLDLYANIRPAKNYTGVESRYSNVDLVIVRENTEGMYSDRNLHFNHGEFMTDEKTALSLRVVTKKASERLAKAGYELAKARNKHLSIIHKKNVLVKTCGLFYETAQEVGENYPDVVTDDYHVDAFAFHLVKQPETFDVIVTTNMFGDILSDLTAGLVGSMGLAPGLNVGDNFLLAQATHGSAPEIAGQNKANPIAEILSAKMMLEWLGIRHHDQAVIKAAQLVDQAVEEVLAKGQQTKDLGGKLTTSQFGTALCEMLHHLGKQG